jgi:hypothetical protein
MSTLTQQLADYQAGFKQRAPAERVAMMEAATAQLRATGIETGALQVGATLPALSLPDATGKPLDLTALNASGPLVIVFYRGGWCPYCNLGAQWQRLLPQLRERGHAGGDIAADTRQLAVDSREERTGVPGTQ